MKKFKKGVSIKLYKSTYGYYKTITVEELNEFIETPSTEEAGDMYEVFISILQFHEINFVDVISVAHDKKTKRGGFDNKIILETVNANR